MRADFGLIVCVCEVCNVFDAGATPELTPPPQDALLRALDADEAFRAAVTAAAAAANRDDFVARFGQSEGNEWMQQ